MYKNDQEGTLKSPTPPIKTALWPRSVRLPPSRQVWWLHAVRSSQVRRAAL